MSFRLPSLLPGIYHSVGFDEGEVGSADVLMVFFVHCLIQKGTRVSRYLEPVDAILSLETVYGGSGSACVYIKAKAKPINIRTSELGGVASDVINASDCSMFAVL